MWDIIINGIVSIISVTGGVFFMRSKYRAEVDKLRAEADQMKSTNRNAEITLLANASQTLLSNIVKPLEDELNKVRHMVGKLQKSIGKLYDCPGVVDCPVRIELHREEADSGNDNPKTGD